MSQHFATQCPECQSRFQVTLEQLNKAQGLVRCGACMKVFAADQYLQTQEAPAPQKPTTEAEGPSGAQIPHIPIPAPATTDLNPAFSDLEPAVPAGHCRIGRAGALVRTRQVRQSALA